MLEQEKEAGGFRGAVARIERAGAAFYRALAASHPEGRLRDLFEYIAEEEEQHASRWDKDAAVPDCRVLDEALEAAGDLLFFTIDDACAAERIAAGVDSGEQGLKLALLGEKDSILFYSEIRNKTCNRAAVEALDMVIADERRHFDTVYALLKIFRRSSRSPQADPAQMDRLLREAVERDESRR